MTTMTGYGTPTGMTESTGRVAIDFWRVLRHPGAQYWITTIATAERIVRSAGPLTFFVCFFNGTFTVITGASILMDIGTDPGLVGLILANLGLREATLIVGTTAIAASMGAGYVTELGAMRVSEEIDAIECIGLRSYPYLVSTRVIGAFIASWPIYCGAILATFAGGWFSAIFQAGALNPGNFGEWFNLGYAPMDIIYTLFKGVIATVIVAIVCASFGYRAQGGPVGVGMAVGEAMNMSLVLVMIVNLFLSYAFWGIGSPTQL